jgi:hypothetical protein
MGKGHQPRKGHNPAKQRKNYDKIDWSKPKVTKCSSELTKKSKWHPSSPYKPA